MQAGGEIQRAALLVDAREGGQLEKLPAILRQMRGENPATLVFIEANEDALLRPVQLPPARRRRRQLPRTLVGDPGFATAAHARAGQGRRPAGPARHPALRPDPARHLPQRPGAHRRRVQPALRLADQRQGPPSGLKPHDDLLAHFPYLGPPNPATARPAGPARRSRLVRQARLANERRRASVPS